LPDIETEDIPFTSEDIPLSKAVEQFENHYIKRILARCRGKKKKAAEIMGVDRRTLYNKLKKDCD